MMDKTYLALQRQMVELQKEMERTKRKEQRGVIRRIQRALVDYGITATQLGYSAIDQPLPEEVLPATAPAVTGTRPPKYRNPKDGATWTGAGRMPHWLREAIDSGKRQEDFLVGKFKAAAESAKKPHHKKPPKHSNGSGLSA